MKAICVKHIKRKEFRANVGETFEVALSGYAPPEAYIYKLDTNLSLPTSMIEDNHLIDLPLNTFHNHFQIYKMNTRY